MFSISYMYNEAMATICETLYKIVRWLNGLVGGNLPLLDSRKISVEELYKSMTRGKPLNDEEIKRLRKSGGFNQALIEDYAKHWRFNNHCKELMEVRDEKFESESKALCTNIWISAYELRMIEKGAVSIDDLLEIKCMNAQASIKEKLRDMGILPEDEEEKFDPVEQGEVINKLEQDMRDGI